MTYSLFFKHNKKETKSGLAMEIIGDNIEIHHFYNGDDVNKIAIFNKHFFNEGDAKKIMKNLFDEMQKRFND